LRTFTTSPFRPLMMPPPAYRIASFSLQSRVAPRMIASPPRSVPLRHAIIPPIHRIIATDQHRSPRERDRVTSAATVRIRLFFFGVPQR
jgi:hypothetical protein